MSACINACVYAGTCECRLVEILTLVNRSSNCLTGGSKAWIFLNPRADIDLEINRTFLVKICTFRQITHAMFLIV